MQQRLRVGTTLHLGADLMMAGAGAPGGGAIDGLADELLRARCSRCGSA